MYILVLLKFAPLEFETILRLINNFRLLLLKFAPLEFETDDDGDLLDAFAKVKICSVGV